MTMTTAEVHKKYNKKFRDLMSDMTGELKSAVQVERVRDLEIEQHATIVLKKTTGGNIDNVVLTDAYLDMRIRYG